MNTPEDLTQTASGGKRKREPPPPALQWIPWEKILIWGLFLTLVFVMRHFFLIIFLTFITSYIMRNLVVWLASFVSPNRSNLWLERGITVICFLALLYGLYQTGRFFGPRLIAQAQALAGRATQMDPKKEFENLLGRTVGPLLFHRAYGDRNDPRYVKQFEQFKAAGSPRFVEFQEFETLEASIEGSLELDMENEERQRLLAELARKGGNPGKEFDDWYLRTHAAVAVERSRESLTARWETRMQTTMGAEQFAAMRKRPDYPEVRDDGLRRDALETARKDPRRFAELLEEWKQSVISHRIAERKASPDYEERLKSYYEHRRQQSPAVVKFDFDKYRRLSKAFRKGEAAFTEELGKIDSPSEEQNVEQAYRDFAAKEQVALAIQWWNTDQTALAIKSALGKSINDMAGAAGSWVRDAIRYTITLPVQIVLSLMLSFFITIDIPSMKKGLNRLKTSRAAGLYEEIAPGLSSFGWLMGRAFQAQALIALCNTILTFIAIKLIGIDNEVFLCAIVFICSFIPVVGVVLSSAPIAVMAIIQPQGSIWLAIIAIAAILIIHFVETSVFNPKILGDMLHLHPVLVLTILAVGEHFFGVWGLLLGTPVAVYIIRFIILDEGIPGVIEPIRRQPAADLTPTAAA